MYRETKFDLNKKQIEAGVKDLEKVKSLLEQTSSEGNTSRTNLGAQAFPFPSTRKNTNLPFENCLASKPESFPSSLESPSERLYSFVMPESEQPTVPKYEIPFPQPKQAAITPNSRQDEINELFQEIAALKGQTVSKTVEEVNYGILQYLDAAMMPEPDTDSLAKNIIFCHEKMKKISQSIESCWDFFSKETQKSFVQISSEYKAQGENKSKGWKGWYRRAKLIIFSIINRENLLLKYEQIYFLIPDAVERVLSSRKGKLLCI